MFGPDWEHTEKCPLYRAVGLHVGSIGISVGGCWFCWNCLSGGVGFVKISVGWC